MTLKLSNGQLGNQYINKLNDINCSNTKTAKK